MVQSGKRKASASSTEPKKKMICEELREELAKFGVKPQRSMLKVELTSLLEQARSAAAAAAAGAGPEAGPGLSAAAVTGGAGSSAAAAGVGPGSSAAAAAGATCLAPVAMVTDPTSLAIATALGTPSKIQERVVLNVDPLVVPPHKYTRSIFKANNPFINVMTTDKPVGHGFNEQHTIDKFNSIEMNGEVLFQAMLRCEEKYVTPISRLFGKDCHSEKQGHSLHSSLFYGLQDCVVPTNKFMDQLRLKQKDYSSVTGTTREEIPNLSFIQQHDHMTGLAIQGTPDVEGVAGAFGSQDSQENNGLDLKEEQPPKVSDTHTGWGFADMGFYIDDFRPENKEPLMPVQEFEAQRLTVQLERKWFKNSDSEHGVFQGACYSVQEMRKNLLRGHKTPIYIPVLCENRWTYGKLEARGFIKLKNGEVDDQSFPEFQSMESKMKYETKMSMSDLSARLQKRKLYNDLHFQKPVVYVDTTYLVGNLFVSSEWYDLPVANNCYSAGGRKFYEGLLRAIVGESITGWSIKEFHEVLELNEKIIKELSLIERRGRMPNPPPSS